MQAEIVTIGDELCRGEVVDRNAAFLASRLWDLSIATRWMTTCGDDAGDLAAAVRAAAARADVVVCTGGLGPGEDDRTVDVVAGLAGVDVVDVVMDLAAAARPVARGGAGAARGGPARVPRGAAVLASPAGRAPGFEVALGGVPVLCLPGSPCEVRALFDAGVADRLRARAAGGPALARRVIRSFGLGEAEVAAACAGAVEATAGEALHVRAQAPEVLVEAVVRGAPEAAAARLEAVEAAVRARLGAHAYGTGERSLAEVVGERLAAAGLTVATAESCTGGLVGALLTAVPGSSRYYRGGAITYADEEKRRQLGVRAETLAAHGAVAEATAREMAAGAVARFGVDLAVAVTGVAGPGGGSAAKPVGTVWLACARRAGEVIVRRLEAGGDRDEVRAASAWWALRMLLDGAEASLAPVAGRAAAGGRA